MIKETGRPVSFHFLRSSPTTLDRSSRAEALSSPIHRP